MKCGGRSKHERNLETVCRRYVIPNPKCTEIIDEQGSACVSVAVYLVLPLLMGSSPDSLHGDSGHLEMAPGDIRCTWTFYVQTPLHYWSSLLGALSSYHRSSPWTLSCPSSVPSSLAFVQSWSVSLTSGLSYSRKNPCIYVPLISPGHGAPWPPLASMVGSAPHIWQLSIVEMLVKHLSDIRCLIKHYLSFSLC